jgi:hypothetical protein
MESLLRAVPPALERHSGDAVAAFALLSILQSLGDIALLNKARTCPTLLTSVLDALRLHASDAIAVQPACSLLTRLASGYWARLLPGSGWTRVEGGILQGLVGLLAPREEGRLGDPAAWLGSLSTQFEQASRACAWGAGLWGGGGLGEWEGHGTERGGRWGAGAGLVFRPPVGLWRKGPHGALVSGLTWEGASTLREGLSADAAG